MADRADIAGRHGIEPGGKAEEEQGRREDEANRTEEQRFGDAIVEARRPGTKRARNAALIRSLHGDDAA
jgi:hypothetical protein